jgi:hypothetical protein
LLEKLGRGSSLFRVSDARERISHASQNRHLSRLRAGIKSRPRRDEVHADIRCQRLAAPLRRLDLDDPAWCLIQRDGSRTSRSSVEAIHGTPFCRATVAHPKGCQEPRPKAVTICLQYITTIIVRYGHYEKKSAYVLFRHARRSELWSWPGGRTVDKETRCQSTPQVISCVRCRLDVSVISEDGALKLSYDYTQWRRTCCCAERPGPTYCCSFLTLEDTLRELPRPPKDGR